MADIDRIKRNLSKMVDQGAPEADLDAYLASEGFKSADDWRAASMAKPKTVGAAMAVQSPRIEDAPQLMPGPRTATMPEPGRPWLDVGKNALANVLPDTAKVVGETVNAFVNPVQTGKALYGLGRGALNKLNQPHEFTPGGAGKPRITARAETPEELQRRAEIEAPADALGDYYATRYGSMEGFKNALAEEPAHILMDVATVGTAGAALPGKPGQVASAVSKVDPLTMGGNALRLTGKGAEAAGSNALGMTTGAGTESVRAAGRAGREGGEAAKSFTENMRGAPVSAVVDRARFALDQLRRERSAAYKGDMAKLGKDDTVLDFAGIDGAVGNAQQVGSFKGVSVEPAATEIVTKMAKQIEDWKGLDPAEYHTAVGIDALKRSLGNLRDSAPYGSPERVAADRIYNAVRGEITAQAPEYAKTMEAYGKASDLIDEAGGTFSLGEKARGDTAARKLLSATRNNVQTNYGERQRLLNALAERDPTLPETIAGQSFNALAPRGLVGRGGAMMALGGIAADPISSLAYLAASSPRIVGETVYLGGKAVGLVDDVASALGITPARLRAIEVAGYQGGQADLAGRARQLRNTNALTVQP